jgi:hypothetical protein
MEERIDFRKILDHAIGKDCDVEEYRKLVGSLQYIVNWTRLDINNAVVVLSQFLT